MNNYLISQVLVFIASVFIAFSYFAKSKKNVMILCVAYCILYSAHCLLLGAFTGMFMSLISASRNIWFYISAKKNKKNNIGVLILFCGIAIITAIYSYNDFFSIISMMANILSTYSIWQDNIKKYRIYAIPVSICYVIYAIRINSVISIVIEAILLIIEIISILDVNYKNVLGSENYEEI